MSEGPTTTWHWKVFFRHDVMGFTKSYEVIAPFVGGAITEATSCLLEAGYDPEAMPVISVARIRGVGT